MKRNPKEPVFTTMPVPKPKPGMVHTLPVKVGPNPKLDAIKKLRGKMGK